MATLKVGRKVLVSKAAQEIKLEPPPVEEQVVLEEEAPAVKPNTVRIALGAVVILAAGAVGFYQGRKGR